MSGFDIDILIHFGYTDRECNRHLHSLYNPRGRNGFDGDFEVRGASSGGNRLKILTLKLNANNNLAYAA